MVLEERIEVPDEETAKDIVQYLKKSGISSRIITEPTLETPLILSGLYRDLVSYLEGMRDGTIPEENDDEKDEDEEASLRNANKDLWEEMLSALGIEYRALASVLEMCKPGDIIGENAYRILLQENGTGSSCTPDELACEMATIRTLSANRVLEIKEQGFVLTRTVHQDEIPLYISYAYPIPPEEDVCNRYRITCIRQIKGIIRYFVQTGPDIIFLEDPDTFLSYLSGQGVDMQVVLRITERLVAKLIIVHEFISTLSECGDISLDNLRTSFLQAIVAEEGGGHLQDRFGLSPGFVDRLVGEMRKLNLVKGKDAKMKLTRIPDSMAGKNR
jgi:hypothetical protein